MKERTNEKIGQEPLGRDREIASQTPGRRQKIQTTECYRLSVQLRLAQVDPLIDGSAKINRTNLNLVPASVDMVCEVSER